MEADKVIFIDDLTEAIVKALNNKLAIGQILILGAVMESL